MLGGLANTIFASKYTLYLPNRGELLAQVEKVLQSEDDVPSRGEGRDGEGGGEFDKQE